MTQQRYLNSQPGAREDELEGRQLLRDMEDAGVAALGPPDSRLEEIYVEIPVNDGSGWQSTCKVFRPKHANPDKKCTLIIMFHGGGFRRGSPEMYTRPGREFVVEFDAVVVSVEYRFTPEYPWPTGVLDAYDVCSYLGDAALSGNDDIFGQDVKVDTSGFVIAGASAGANIACAVLSLCLLSSSAPAQPELTHGRSPLKLPIIGVYLGVAFLLDRESVPSKYADLYTSRQIDPQESDLYDELLRVYNPDLTSPLFSPVNSLGSELAKWPKTYIQIGGRDIVRDDGIILEKCLNENGVQTKLDQYDTFGHTTWCVYTTGPDMGVDSPLGKNSMAGMRWLLGRE